MSESDHEQHGRIEGDVRTRRRYQNASEVFGSDEAERDGGNGKSAGGSLPDQRRTRKSVGRDYNLPRVEPLRRKIRTDFESVRNYG